MSYLVYVATNKFNDGEYVGVTMGSMRARMQKHYWDAYGKRPGCRVFNAAIRKYGREAFEWVTLLDGLEYAEAMQAEIDVIAERKPRHNILAGGRGFRGHKRTPEQIAKQAARLRGLKRTPEQIERITASRRTPEYRERAAAQLRGKKRSPETIARMKENRNNTSLWKAVVCLEDGKDFKSLMAAKSEYGIKDFVYRNIGEFRFRSAGDIHFLISKDSLTPECRSDLLDLFNQHRKYQATLGRNGVRGRPKISVICVTDSSVHSTAKEAAAAYGVSAATVWNLCKHGGRSKGGIGFRFEGEKEVLKAVPSPESLAARREKMADRFKKYAAMGPKASSRSVICLDDGLVFESAAAAARHYGVFNSSVIEICGRNPRRVTAAGKVFRYTDDIEDDVDAITAAAHKRTSERAAKGKVKLMKPVICLNDGNRFQSAVEAANKYGIHRSFIGEICRGIKKSSKGYKFEYEAIT